MYLATSMSLTLHPYPAYPGWKKAKRECNLKSVINWTVLTQNSYVEALTNQYFRNVTVYEDQAFKEIVKLKQGHLGEL